MTGRGTKDRARFEPGLPKTGDPDPDLTGLFLPLLISVFGIRDLVGSFARIHDLIALKPACLELFGEPGTTRA